MNTPDLKIVIIDDEEDARNALRAFLDSFCPEVKILGEAEGVPTGVRLITKTEPDVVLLDIQMGGATGFDLLDQFSNPDFQIIFCTAYDQFALKAIKYAALDYLVKPVDPSELVKAMSRAKRAMDKHQSFQTQIQQLLTTARTQNFEKITLHTAEGLVFLLLKDILYLQSDGNYSLFYTYQGEKIITSKTLKQFEEFLPQDSFCRVHQSYIINIHFVKKILREDGGYALLEKGAKVPISRRKKDAFLKLMTG